jgi:hypothetical protein
MRLFRIQAIHGIMAVTMKQAQVVETVVGVVSVPSTNSGRAVVMHFRHVFCREA